MQVKINKLANSLIEIEGELPYEEFIKQEESVFKKLSESLELPGFRKGHVPKEIALKNIPDSVLLAEMAEKALPRAYIDILKQEKIEAIGQPEITITKLARGNPLGFKIKTSVLPELKLPDYKNLAKEAVKDLPVENLEVSDEEVEQAILEIRKIRAEHKHGPSHPVGDSTESSGASHTCAPDEECHDELPELNDDFVKQLGNFASVSEFKNKLRDNIKFEKEMRSKDQKRIKIIESILKKIPIELPEIMIESELDKMLSRLKADLERGGFKFDDYLKQIGKTEEDIRNEWRPNALKNSQVGLILHKIAEAEKLDDYEKVFDLLESQ